ncbi:MerR family transcriptional regulator [Alkaliphilus sp. MSJ-5]|uniref:MerR family transcriptional regulator n=1 Tax=Alkaliphilus flagellatus TaxID=2841507 RepID=A0ABS6FZM7_9FIRM|nr:MerR family transcriptional regulator [Alkaliphilus flagellatus]MBU5675700.1 MerR family transcriptional regulator [Alkaliphilus flagellatus]
MGNYRTSEVAKIIGVHPNTVISYEKLGYISTVARMQNRYRIYTEQHIEQIKMARLALKSESVKTYMRLKVRDILRTLAKGDLDKALLLSQNFLLKIQKEKDSEYKAIKEIKKVLKEYVEEKQNISLKRSKVAESVGVSIDVIINWERNGILSIPRNNKNNYRIYSENELVLLKIIKLLRDENYSTQCIRKMIVKIKFNDFEFLNKDDELLSSIEEKEKDLKNLISHINKLINER